MVLPAVVTVVVGGRPRCVSVGPAPVTLPSPTVSELLTSVLQSLTNILRHIRVVLCHKEPEYTITALSRHF